MAGPTSGFAAIRQGIQEKHKDLAGLSRRLQNLFQAMAQGGEFGADLIRPFNGGLFADTEVIDLTWDEIDTLILVNAKDWSNVEPNAPPGSP